ncbi:outer membrane protein [Bartonella rattimassiliensis]|uniref:Porin n=1 Tax=Bartonella rattimassiliensis 15908 TaxID=1094556 RepID=J0QKY6_9HYPH|nr:outer membrane protein [Bartonella rattimassiliensis]EJF83614.1 hypothetical protein MCY_01198 [Bartonella rattimassiliensis 15908]
MNTKRLITASVFSLISASTALAADVQILQQPASSTSSAIVVPTFSWTGLYLGVQAGGFSSKADLALIDQDKSFPLDKEVSPKLSGFIGGFYAGSNIDLGDNFIFSIDTDLMLSGKKHTKTITIGAADSTTVENTVGRSRRSAASAPPVAKPVAAKPVAAKPVAVKPVATRPASPTQLLKATGNLPKGSTKSVSPATGEKSVEGSVALGSPTPAGPQTSSNEVTESQTKSVGDTALKSSAQSAPGSKPGSSDTGTNRMQLTSSVSGVSGPQPVAPKPSSSNTEAGASERSASLSLARSDTGGQQLEARVNESRTSVTSTPVQTVEKKPVSLSVSSTGTESNRPIVKTAAEKTIPSAGLKLARSGASGSETNVSNGTGGAQHGGHSSAYGNGSNANPHGSHHGHGSGSYPHGTHPHGGQSVAGHGAQSAQVAENKSDSSVYGVEQMKKVASELGLDQEDEVEALSHTFKQNWGGATRVRIGFAADRFMPYLAGGIAYGQFQDTVSISVKNEDGGAISSKNLTDETKTMIGYTIGGGIDFALLDNVIVRAEYRYFDFGKKKFAKEKFEVNYKTNDFRVGVAYKF